ncbi:MAG: hypothetical protein KKB39_05065 [Nanoarchaeota archaeon]|nr:hypothetical protein [Nanoarchaeota archaeon]MCG2720042.1 tRNA wybutosine-synthesizing 3 family protein [Nanoarchaeota archaeon]
MDKSPQGHIDEDIKPLLEKINKHKEYETTSSCSGRIVLLENQKKGTTAWKFKSHTKVNVEDVWKNLSEDNIWFMQEPMILHVKCKDLESAKELIDKANKVGFKAAALSPKTFTVVIQGVEKIETILNKKLISKEYLTLLVEEANKKLLATKKRMKELENLF